MVNLVTGNLFDSEAQTLVNAVNCAGVMGKGIALAFKRRYPAMFADYAARCKEGRVRLGEPYLYRGESLPWMLNFPTKGHWRSRRWAVARASSHGMSLGRCYKKRSAGWIFTSSSMRPSKKPSV